MFTDNNYMDYIHEKLMIIIKQFDEYCRKHNIKYSVCGGSAIGAVRHKGFIPWDDDVDVCLKRDEYNRLIECLTNEPIDGLFLQTYKTDKNYPHDFAKLRMEGTEDIGEYIQSRIPMKQGIFFDIFPLDKVNSKHHKFNIAVCRVLDYMIWFKSALLYPPKLWMYPVVFILELLLVFPFLCNFIPIRFLSKLREKWFIRNNNKDCDSVGAFSSYVGLTTCMPKEIWDDQYIDVPFEDGKVMLLKNYDAYLSLVYHDYMTPPPVDKQMGKHAYVPLKK